MNFNKYNFSHSLQIMCKFNSLVHVHENYGTPSFLHPNLLIKSYIPKIIYMYWTKMMDALGKHHLQKSMYSDVEALNYPSTKVAIYGKSWACRCLSLSYCLPTNQKNLVNQSLVNIQTFQFHFNKKHFVYAMRALM